MQRFVRQNVRWFAPFLLVLISFSLSAQTPNSGDITIHATVNTKSGDPVLNLHQNDFTLLDNKRPEPIIDFRSTAAQPTSVIIVLDDVNLPYSTLTYARQQLAAYLGGNDGHLQQPTTLAVLQDTGVQIIPRFTTNGNDLRAALSKQSIGLRALRRSAGFYGAAERMQISLQAFNSMVTQRIGKGPTLMLWISEGWPLLSGPRVDLNTKEQTPIFRNVVDLTTKLRQAQITIDMINPFGASESIAYSNYYEVFEKAPRRVSDAVLGNLALQVIAKQSGGQVILGTNDVAGAMKQLVRETTSGYDLTFHAAPGDHEDEYHELQLKVDRPDLRVHSTAGYYARPLLSATEPKIPEPLPQ